MQRRSIASREVEESLGGYRKGLASLQHILKDQGAYSLWVANGCGNIQGKETVLSHS